MQHNPDEELLLNSVSKFITDLQQENELLKRKLQALAAKDAALDAALEALHSIDQQIDLSKYPSAPPDVTLLDELRDAITKIKEAMK